MPRTSELLSTLVDANGTEFRILKLLGEGGMGAVYKAEEPQLNRIVAIKKIKEQLIKGTTVLDRLRSEAKALAKLEHPNIVAIYSMSVAEDKPFLVLEYIQGTTLAEELQKHGPLGAQRFRQIFEQVLTALQFAHEQGFVHRDLKPENIMITEDNTVKLMDFGISKALTANQDQSLSNSGNIVGTPSYMSPEQCEGKEIDYRSDIYSLACVMYECLTGRQVFEGSSPIAVVYKHMNETPLLQAGHGKLTESMVPVLMRCLAKDPAKRPQSVTDLKEFLDTVGFGSASLPPAYGSRERTPTLLANRKIQLSGLALFIIIISAIVLYLKPEDKAGHREKDQQTLTSALDEANLVIKGLRNHEFPNEEQAQTARNRAFARLLDDERLAEGEIKLDNLHDAQVNYALAMLGPNYDFADKRYRQIYRWFKSRSKPEEVDEKMLAHVCWSAGNASRDNHRQLKAALTGYMEARDLLSKFAESEKELEADWKYKIAEIDVDMAQLFYERGLQGDYEQAAQFAAAATSEFAELKRNDANSFKAKRLYAEAVLAEQHYPEAFKLSSSAASELGEALYAHRMPESYGAIMEAALLSRTAMMASKELKNAKFEDGFYNSAMLTLNERPNPTFRTLQAQLVIEHARNLYDLNLQPQAIETLSTGLKKMSELNCLAPQVVQSCNAQLSQLKPMRGQQRHDVFMNVTQEAIDALKVVAL